MEYRDRKLVCAGCREAFVWTAAEQLFFADHALRHEPRRCPACRQRPRAAEARPRVGRARVEVAAVCAACGRETTIPFQPSQGRPVYCRDCYAKGRVAQKVAKP